MGEEAGTRFTLDGGEMVKALMEAKGHVVGEEHLYIPDVRNFGVSTDHSVSELLSIKDQGEYTHILTENYTSHEDYIEADRFMAPVHHFREYAGGEETVISKIGEVVPPEGIEAEAPYLVHEVPGTSTELFAPSESHIGEVAPLEVHLGGEGAISHESFLENTLGHHEMSGFGEIGHDDVFVAEELVRRENAMDGLLGQFQRGEIDYNTFQDKWERIRVPVNFQI